MAGLLRFDGPICGFLTLPGGTVRFRICGCCIAGFVENIVNQLSCPLLTARPINNVAERISQAVAEKD